MVCSKKLWRLSGIDLGEADGGLGASAGGSEGGASEEANIGVDGNHTTLVLVVDGLREVGWEDDLVVVAHDRAGDGLGGNVGLGSHRADGVCGSHDNGPGVVANVDVTLRGSNASGGVEDTSDLLRDLDGHNCHLLGSGNEKGLVKAFNTG